MSWVSHGLLSSSCSRNISYILYSSSVKAIWRLNAYKDTVDNMIEATHNLPPDTHRSLPPSKLKHVENIHY